MEAEWLDFKSLRWPKLPIYKTVKKINTLRYFCNTLWQEQQKPEKLLGLHWGLLG